MHRQILQQLKNSYDIIKSGLRYFILAPECLECKTLLRREERCFCSACLHLFELLDPSNRCDHCFKEMKNQGQPICSDCLKSEHWMTKVASACDYIGPAATMIRLMKYGNQPTLAKTAAAYMALQWVSLEWPLPDFIIPTPCTWLRRFDRGYNQAELMALELGSILGVPVATNLKRKVGDFSQAGLSREQRLSQPLSTFYVRGKPVLEDKIVLLVDDVMTTGRTLNVCAEVIQGQLPKDIYGLTFCKAVEG